MYVDSYANPYGFRGFRYNASQRKAAQVITCVDNRTTDIARRDDRSLSFPGPMRPFEGDLIQTIGYAEGQGNGCRGGNGTGIATVAQASAQ